MTDPLSRPGPKDTVNSLRLSATASASAPAAIVLVAIGAATAAAHIGNNFTTFLVGGLIDRYGFTPSQMGLFSMAETLAYALAMFTVAPRAAWVSARQLGMGASVLVVTAQTLSSGMSSLPLLIAARVATGLGFGLMNSAVNIAASRHGQPARALSTGIACQTLLFAAINIGLPMVGAGAGLGGMFIALALLSAVLGLAALALPAAPAVPVSEAAPLRRKTPISRDGRRLLLAMALFAAGSLAIWPFMERAAHAIGMPATTFGRYQSVATLVSALGNAMLAALVARIARRRLLTTGLLVCGVSCAALTTASQQWTFGLALIAFNSSWFIAYPLLLGVAYTRDTGGRLAVMMTGTWLLSQSVASLGAGFVAQLAGSYWVIGPVGLIGCILALVITWPLAADSLAIESLAVDPPEPDDQR